MKKKEKRGGARKNAGAKPKYSEPTKTVAFRCPTSKVDELKLLVKSKLSEWSVKCKREKEMAEENADAKNLNRNYIMMEQDPEHYQTACKRVLT